MTERSETILAQARTYVTDLLKEQLDKKLVFHSLEHTEDVVDASSMMAGQYQLSEEDKLVLLLAAWFHDTGYTQGKAEGHEEVSVQIAASFLEQHTVEEVVVQRVSSAIRATKMPQSPLSQVEQILCDADLLHLSTADFKPRNELLKLERENLLGGKIDKKDWRKSNIDFLTSHHYFTEYGQKYLEPKKQAIIHELKKRGSKKQKEEVKESKTHFPYLSEKPQKGSTTKEEAKNAERGVQTMFRTTSHNHLQLSAMADSKSHILISVSSIILSVSVSFLIARLSYYPQYIIPTGILVAACMGAATFAILSTRPSISSGRFTEEDIRNKKTNLLFFGNFHQMELGDYQWGMNEMIKDKDYLYNTMIMDIYYLGVVLAKKYRYLRIAYTIFMWGLILAVVAFAVAAVVSDAMSAATVTDGKVIDY